MVERIFIVEDDKELRNYLVEFLRQNGYQIEGFSEGSAAINYIKKIRPELIILDLGLPDISGESVCLSIKSIYPELPVIMLTAKSTSAEVTKGLNLGADDYVSKPFDSDKLLARIKARLRKPSERASIYEVEDLRLDGDRMQVWRNGLEISLTKTEFDLLKYLMMNSGRVLSRDNILNRIWLYSPDIESRVVDVHIGYLRKKIDKGAKKKLINSVRGFGYILGDRN